MPKMFRTLAFPLCAALVTASALSAQTGSQSNPGRGGMPAGNAARLSGTIAVRTPTQSVLLRFQLIKAQESKTTDPSLQSIDAALKDLFRFAGYRLLASAAVMLDYTPSQLNLPTMQRVVGEGVPYQLSASIETATPDAVQLSVKLWGLPGAPAGSIGQLFSTKVSVAYGHTVVLGSTQLAGVEGGTLILAVKPELPTGKPEGGESALDVFQADQVDDPVAFLNGPSPRYPDSLRSANLSGRVTLRFIVGVDGKVETPIQLLSSTHPGFEAPALDAIRASNFRPALVRGTKVRQMVEQVVRFVPSTEQNQGAFTVDQVDDPVAFASGPPPKYPEELKAAGVAGKVTLRFVVGSDGRVEPGSLKVLQSSNKQFEAPAIDAIQHSTFRPAMLKGAKVRQMVEQVVRFTAKKD